MLKNVRTLKELHIYGSEKKIRDWTLEKKLVSLRSLKAEGMDPGHVQPSCIIALSEGWSYYMVHQSGPRKEQMALSHWVSERSLTKRLFTSDGQEMKKKVMF